MTLLTNTNKKYTTLPFNITLFSQSALLLVFIVIYSHIDKQTISGKVTIILSLLMLFIIFYILNALYAHSYRSIHQENKEILSKIDGKYREINDKYNDQNEFLTNKDQLIINNMKIENLLDQLEYYKSKGLIVDYLHQSQLEELYKQLNIPINKFLDKQYDHEIKQYYEQVENISSKQQQNQELKKELNNKLIVYYSLIEDQKPGKTIDCDQILHLIYFNYDCKDKVLYNEYDKMSIINIFNSKTYWEGSLNQLKLKYIYLNNNHYLSINPQQGRSFIIQLDENLNIYQLFIQFQGQVYHYTYEKNQLNLTEVSEYSQWTDIYSF